MISYVPAAASIGGITYFTLKILISKASVNRGKTGCFPKVGGSEGFLFIVVPAYLTFVADLVDAERDLQLVNSFDLLERVASRCY